MVHKTNVTLIPPSFFPQIQCLYKAEGLYTKALYPEAALQSYIYKKAFWKYAANLQENTISPVHLLHILRAPFPKNTSGRLLVIIAAILEGGFGVTFLHLRKSVCAKEHFVHHCLKTEN